MMHAIYPSELRLSNSLEADGCVTIEDFISNHWNRQGGMTE